jgi:hypothetical protein
VHEECLKTWLVKKKDDDLTHCELCKDVLQMQFTVRSVCMPFRGTATCKAWAPCLVALVLLAVIVYICYMAIEMNDNGVLLTVGALVLGFVCIACCVKSIFTAFHVCFERRIEEWKIEGVAKVEVL